jgi:hypothetical protein
MDLVTDHRSASRVVRSSQRRAVKPLREPRVAVRVCRLEEDAETAFAAEPETHPLADVRSIWAFMDLVNEIERRQQDYDAAPGCTNCIGGITADDDICQFCCGEGRLL